MKCVYCHGSGIDPVQAIPCQICQGTAEIPDPEPGDKSCKFCQGSGMDPVNSRPCRICNGLGYQQKDKQKVLRVEDRDFINQSRIQQLESIKSNSFDFTKLVQLCNELNNAFSTHSFYSCGMLIRAIVDHIPPIFGFTSFMDFSNQYGTKSFKDSMNHLEKGCRKLADGYLHEHIRKKESIPTVEQIDYRSPLDKLLAEIIDKLL